METNSRTGIESRLKVLSKRRGWLFEYAAKQRQAQLNSDENARVFFNTDAELNKAIGLIRKTNVEIYELMGELRKVGPIKRGR